MNDDTRNGTPPKKSSPEAQERADQHEVLHEELRRLRHDARGALNHILGFNAILLEDAEEEGRESAVADLGRVASAARSLLTHVDRLAEIAREGLSATHREPVKNALSQNGSIHPPPLQECSEGSVKEKILVVDDVEMNREVLSRRLKRTGYDVIDASGGQEALAAVKKISFDLVLLDVMMPEMDGFEVLERLRRSHDASSLPVIIVTALGDSEDVVKALEQGANDYVTKPLDFPVVLARVAAQLSSKKAHDEVQRLNERLRLAQERISHLAESSMTALQDIESWSVTAAEDLALAIDVDSIEVWIFQGEELVGVTSPGAPAPTTVDLQTLERSRSHLKRSDELLLPILGLSGELFGALVVSLSGSILSESDTRILGSFARQLGGALELRRTRTELAKAAERRRQRQEELLERGVDVLKLCPTCQRCYDHTVACCEKDGALLSTPPTFPYRVDRRYRLARVLGQGGMGMVFEAYDERLEREVALKVIRSEHFDNEMVRLRFEKEARAVASIEHPGVVAIYDCGEIEDGAQYLVMELLRGADVSKLVASGGPGTPRQIAALLRQGSEAVDAAHHAEIIHRDIKPDNLFLVSKDDSEVGFYTKVLDFGVAKESKANTRLTQTGMLVGTPLFMSPEQLLGKDVDYRTDIYSFAASAFLALTGRRVTLEEEFINVMLDICHTDPPPLSSLLSGIPPEVDQAFALALSRDPEDRPESVETWVSSFVDILESIPSGVKGWNEETFLMAAQRRGVVPIDDVSATEATRLERKSRL